MDWSRQNAGNEEMRRRREALRTLGLRDDSDQMPKLKEVEDAWRRRAKQLHPDVRAARRRARHDSENLESSQGSSSSTMHNQKQEDDDEATARFRAARDAFELLRGDIRRKQNYLRTSSMGGGDFGSSSSSSSSSSTRWRASERNPFADHGVSESERRRRKARRQRWRDERVMKERDAVRGNVERFLRTKERARFARATRVAEAISRSGIASPYLLVVDFMSLGVIAGSCLFFSGQVQM